MNSLFNPSHLPFSGVKSNFLSIIAAVVIVAPVCSAFAQAGSPSKYGPPTDVEFKANLDGTPQRYVELLPSNFDRSKAHDMLIVFHGHGAPRSWYVQADDPHARATRETAAKHEMIFISPDYRASTSWMGPSAEADVVQIIRDLRQKYWIGNVFLMGNSMGGSSVLTFTAIHPDMVDGAIAIIPLANHLEYRNFQDAISASFGGTKQQIPAEYKKRSAEYWPERFTMPLAIVTGANDTAVPPQSAMHLAEVLSQMGRKVLAVSRPGQGHECSSDDTVMAMEFVFTNTVNRSP